MAASEIIFTTKNAFVMKKVSPPSGFVQNIFVWQTGTNTFIVYRPVRVFVSNS